MSSNIPAGLISSPPKPLEKKGGKNTNLRNNITVSILHWHDRKRKRKLIYESKTASFAKIQYIKA